MNATEQRATILHHNRPGTCQSVPGVKHCVGWLTLQSAHPMPRLIASLRRYARCSPTTPAQPTGKVDVPMIHDGGIDCLSGPVTLTDIAFSIMTGKLEMLPCRDGDRDAMCSRPDNDRAVN